MRIERKVRTDSIQILVETNLERRKPRQKEKHECRKTNRPLNGVGRPFQNLRLDDGRRPRTFVHSRNISHEFLCTSSTRRNSSLSREREKRFTPALDRKQLDKSPWLFRSNGKFEVVRDAKLNLSEAKTRDAQRCLIFAWRRSFSPNIVETMFACIGRCVCRYNSLTSLRLAPVYRIDFELHRVDECTACISLPNELNRPDEGQTTGSSLDRVALVQI